MLLLFTLGAGCAVFGLECGLDDIDLRTTLEAAQLGRADRCQRQGLAEWIDKRRDTHGPWKQDISVARSVDGLVWTALRESDRMPKVVVPTAAVPEVVEAADGRLWLFFVDGDLDALERGADDPAARFVSRGLPGVGALAAAVSTDGIKFERVEVEIAGLGVGMFADPEIIPEPGGSWRMYYLGMTVQEYTQLATWKEGERHEIHTAVSTDLVHWTSQGAVVRGPFADPALACFAGGGCTLFSYGLDVSYSFGGRPFDYRGSWNNVGGFAPDVLSISPTEALLFYNANTTGAPFRAKRTVDAGGSWTDESTAALDVYGESVSVIRRRNGEWWMYFHTFKPGMRLANVPDAPSVNDAAPASTRPARYPKREAQD